LRIHWPGIALRRRHVADHPTTRAGAAAEFTIRAPTAFETFTGLALPLPERADPQE
jgi:hypothetical protein